MLQKDLNFSDMISALQKEFKGRKYDIATIYEEEPRLPIDLFCSKGKGKEQEWCMVIVASINHISEEFQKKLLFYQYYLSLHYKPLQYKVVLAIPASATVATIPYYAKTEEEKKKDFYKEHGFGLWKISKKRNSKGHETFEISEELAPMTLRDRQREKFKNCFASRDNYLSPEEKRGTSEEVSTQLEKIASNDQTSKYIARFFDTYIHDSVYGIAGFNPIKFEERYIDAKLPEQMLKLERISYQDDLFVAISEHLSNKGSEYKFVTDVFSKLWEKWIGISYSNFLETFDPALQHIFAATREEDRGVYRDHYIHQFQVFLLGLYIINKRYDDFIKKCKKPEINWLIISSFHDMAWPVQLYDKWSGEFFNKVFNVKELGHMEIKSNFVDKTFLGCVSYLIRKLCSDVLNEKVEDNWITEKDNLVQFFHGQITDAKNHCILSSIALLKEVRKSEYEEKIKGVLGITGNRRLEFQDILDDIFIPSALAIALHDKKVWQELKKKDILPLLKFEDDPLSFLLIFCDNVQEWGRPSQSAEKEEKKRFYLKELKYDPKRGFDVTIWTPNHTKAEIFFSDKQKELKEIETFLQQPSDRKFAVRLEDKDGKGEDFIMQGSPS